MKLWSECMDYLKDNPEGYWFKRKLYGIGWMPAKKEGWLTLFAYLTFVFVWLLVVVPDKPDASLEVIGPIVGATFLFLIIVWRTGESLRWQWGDKDDNKN